MSSRGLTIIEERIPDTTNVPIRRNLLQSWHALVQCTYLQPDMIPYSSSSYSFSVWVFVCHKLFGLMRFWLESSGSNGGSICWWLHTCSYIPSSDNFLMIPLLVLQWVLLLESRYHAKILLINSFFRGLHCSQPILKYFLNLKVLLHKLCFVRA